MKRAEMKQRLQAMRELKAQMINSAYDVYEKDKKTLLDIDVVMFRSVFTELRREERERFSKEVEGYDQGEVA